MLARATWPGNIVAAWRRCYGRSAMAMKSAYTQRELDDLRGRLLQEKEQLEAQLATIEEATFATSQSDLSGEVSFDDENADAGKGEVGHAPIEGATEAFG